jgi:hypothetical protein
MKEDFTNLTKSLKNNVTEALQPLLQYVGKISEQTKTNDATIPTLLNLIESSVQQNKPYRALLAAARYFELTDKPYESEQLYGWAARYVPQADKYGTIKATLIEAATDAFTLTGEDPLALNAPPKPVAFRLLQGAMLSDPDVNGMLKALDVDGSAVGDAANQALGVGESELAPYYQFAAKQHERMMRAIAPNEALEKYSAQSEQIQQMEYRQREAEIQRRQKMFDAMVTQFGPHEILKFMPEPPLEPNGEPKFAGESKEPHRVSFEEMLCSPKAAELLTGFLTAKGYGNAWEATYPSTDKVTLKMPTLLADAVCDYLGGKMDKAAFEDAIGNPWAGKEGTLRLVQFTGSQCIIPGDETQEEPRDLHTEISGGVPNYGSDADTAMGLDGSMQTFSGDTVEAAESLLMEMSRKHYREAANHLAGEYRNAPSPEHKESVKRTARLMADMFKRDNPNFSHDRFFSAVGMNESEPDDINFDERVPQGVLDAQATRQAGGDGQADDKLRNSTYAANEGDEFDDDDALEAEDFEDVDDIDDGELEDNSSEFEEDDGEEFDDLGGGDAMSGDNFDNSLPGLDGADGEEHGGNLPLTTSFATVPPDNGPLESISEEEQQVIARLNEAQKPLRLVRVNFGGQPSEVVYEGSFASLTEWARQNGFQRLYNRGSPYGFWYTKKGDVAEYWINPQGYQNLPAIQEKMPQDVSTTPADNMPAVEKPLAGIDPVTAPNAPPVESVLVTFPKIRAAELREWLRKAGGNTKTISVTEDKLHPALFTAKLPKDLAERIKPFVKEDQDFVFGD